MPAPLIAAAMPLRLFWPVPIVIDVGAPEPTWIESVPVPKSSAVGSLTLPVLTDSWPCARLETVSW